MVERVADEEVVDLVKWCCWCLRDCRLLVCGVTVLVVVLTYFWLMTDTLDNGSDVDAHTDGKTDTGTTTLL